MWHNMRVLAVDDHFFAISEMMNIYNYLFSALFYQKIFISHYQSE